MTILYSFFMADAATPRSMSKSNTTNYRGMRRSDSIHFEQIRKLIEFGNEIAAAGTEKFVRR